MMRKEFAVALFAVVFGAASAQAGVSYDLAFRVGGGGVANGSQYTFASLAAAQASGPVVADVLLIFNEPFGLSANSVSVGFDNSTGLSVASADEWLGFPLGMMDFYAPFPARGVVVGADQVNNIDGAAPLALQGSRKGLISGTYNIGTIVWDTSGIGAAGILSINTFVLAGLEGTGILDAGNNVVDITGTEVLGTGFINIVPEPATASLIGLGLAGLVLVGRRRNA